MAAIAVQNVDIDGVTPLGAYASASDPDTVINDGAQTFLHVKNGGGGAITVTLDDTGSASPPSAKSFNADIDVVIGAGDEAMIRLGTRARFGGDVQVNYSGTTSVTVAAFKLA